MLTVTSMELWLFSDDRKHQKKSMDKHLSGTHTTRQERKISRGPINFRCFPWTKKNINMFLAKFNRSQVGSWTTKTLVQGVDPEVFFPTPEVPGTWRFACWKIHYEFNESMYFLLNIRDCPSSHLRDFRGVILVGAVMIRNPHPEKKKV